MRSLCHRRTQSWPFWLLVVAWLGANSTPAINFTLLSWLAEARTFSHQARLGAEVAAILSGGESTPTVNQGEKNSGRLPQLPPALIETAFKRFDLAMGDRCLLPAEFPAEPKLAPSTIESMGRLRPPPPHGPPRVGAVG